MILAIIAGSSSSISGTACDSLTVITVNADDIKSLRKDLGMTQRDLAEALSLEVLAAAAGQAFFSLSLGMGAMLTYASYLSRDENLPREAVLVASATPTSSSETPISRW